MKHAMQGISDWVLPDPTATNQVECAEYVARSTASGGVGLFGKQSRQVYFQRMNPTAKIHLSHGRLHQLPARDPTDQFDLPDCLTWPLNVAIYHQEMSLDAMDILDETLVPPASANGAPFRV